LSTPTGRPTAGACRAGRDAVGSQPKPGATDLPAAPLDKAGQTIDLWVSDAMGAHSPRCYKAVPFFLTTGGYGVFLHTSDRVTAWVGSRAAARVQVAVDDGVLDYYLLLGSPADVLAGYTALTGRAPVPPAWSFGWWQSRCSYASAEEVVAVVGEMRDAGIPMDVVHLDTNWFAVDWRCDLEFAPDRFPDPEGLCRELAARGVHLSLWQTPYLVAGPACTTVWPAPAGSSGPRTAASWTSASTSSPATGARCTWSTGPTRRRSG
jgi:alpha-glucosidase (family GH31 glycosyl hydrolase)